MKPRSLTPRVEFCRLDARDDYYTGYSPVAFANDEGMLGLRIGPKNLRLEMELQREYLTRLFALQSELREKYTPKFDANEKPITDESNYDGFPSEVEYRRNKTEVEKMFPGVEAEYYT